VGTYKDTYKDTYKNTYKDTCKDTYKVYQGDKRRCRDGMTHPCGHI